MVVRYPHTATVSVTTTTVTDGEFASESDANTIIKGRFEPSEGATRVKEPDGEYTDITGKFFTKSAKIDGAKTLTVDGVVYNIVYWPPYQNYSEIWLD